MRRARSKRRSAWRARRRRRRRWPSSSACSSGAEPGLMSFLLVRSCGRAVAIALGDVLEVVRTVAMAELDGVRWRGRFGRFDWRGLRVPACELAPRLDGARPRALADYVDGH